METKAAMEGKYLKVSTSNTCYQLHCLNKTVLHKKRIMKVSKEIINLCAMNSETLVWNTDISHRKLAESVFIIQQPQIWILKIKKDLNCWLLRQKSILCLWELPHDRENCRMRGRNMEFSTLR